ncbi:hypothetical protein BN3662_01473 [Clostridiales bacterium CHKCI006]|nr:hypothetical protein BN3662_01473 [Clostridiales bacterium CHKCI006]
MKQRLILMMMSLLLGGCMFSSEQDMSNQDYQYRYFDSSSTGYDYSALIDEQWILSSDSIVSEDLYHLTYESAKLDMYILKDKSTLGLERRVPEQVNQLPEEMDEELARIGLSAEFNVEKSERDYYGEYKFLKQTGQYGDKQFISVFFQTEYVIPSVTGQLVTNCCVILFDNSQEIAEDTITTFERTIEYR